MSSHASRALVIVVVLLSACGLFGYAIVPGLAQSTFDFSVTLNMYSISIAPSHGAYVQVIVYLTSGAPQPVNLTFSVSPQDGELAGSFSLNSGTPTFTTTLTISAYAAPPGKQYTVTVGGTSEGITTQAPTLTVTISCPEGACPQPKVDSTDKTSYAQGQSIQFTASGFVPGDSTDSCLSNNVSPPICQSQADADGQGDVSGSMQVTPAASPGTEFFYLKDTTNDQQTPPVQITILSPSATSTLTTTVSGDGTVAPSCPSGCSEPIGQTMSIAATPATNWLFSGWNITGASCYNGNAANPCAFAMPNTPVSVTGNFVQHQFQQLYTAYTGYGTVTPTCLSGCPVAVGSPVSIIATAAQGWILSGYQVTSGVSCSSQGGETCSFLMPSFPVTFTAYFTPQTTATTTPVTVTAVATATSTLQTSVTSPTTIVSLTTSTTTMSTISATQVGSTVTTITYSTSTGTATQTQLSSITAFSTLTTTVAAIATTLANPTLELALAAIILLSILTIGVGAVRRSPRRGSVACANCGFKNPAQSKFCVSCGEPLGGASKT